MTPCSTLTIGWQAFSTIKFFKEKRKKERKKAKKKKLNKKIGKIDKPIMLK